MANVGGHGAHIPRLHGYSRAGCARVSVFDRPVDLIGQLHKPLDTVVAMNDRQDVLLGRGAVQAVGADGHD